MEAGECHVEAGECHVEAGESATWRQESATWGQERVLRGGKRESATWGQENTTWRQERVPIGGRREYVVRDPRARESRRHTSTLFARDWQVGHEYSFDTGVLYMVRCHCRMKRV